MLGAVVAVLVLWAILGTRVASPARAAAGAARLTVLELLGLAPAAALSRRWERAADRCSLELTGDLPRSSARMSTSRARTSPISSPPRLAYLLLFNHPTPLERLAAGRAWASES